ncbi:hypothetical protein C0J50_23850, partial [Silurus asotus]
MNTRLTRVCREDPALLGVKGFDLQLKLTRGDRSDLFTVHEWEDMMYSYLNSKKCSAPGRTTTVPSSTIFDILKRNFSELMYSNMPMADFYNTLHKANESPMDYWIRLNKAIDVADECLRRRNKCVEDPAAEAVMMFVSHCPDPSLALSLQFKLAEQWSAIEIQERLDCHRRNMKRDSARSPRYTPGSACHQNTVTADCLAALGGNFLFSSVDLTSGFYNIPLHVADRHYTAFTTPMGLYEYNRLPQGLCNCPASFMRMMLSIFGDLNFSSLLCYLDDLLIFARSELEALQRLEVVFSRLRASNLKLSQKKCHFLRRSIKFLGHVISGSGISVDEDKVAIISAFQKMDLMKDDGLTPWQKKVRSFLGMVLYYQSFIPGCSRIAKPLFNLTAGQKRTVKGVSGPNRSGTYRVLSPEDWTPACDAAFVELKGSLVESVVLAHPDFERPFILCTDASLDGLGAVLSQVPTGAVSRAMSLADHLSSLVPDCHDNIHAFSLPELQIQQHEDKVISRVAFYVSRKCRPFRRERMSEDLRVLRFLRQWDKLFLLNDILYRAVKDPCTKRKKFQFAMPDSLKQQALAGVHDLAGHQGQPRTLSLVRKRFYWPGMERDVRDYVKTCTRCVLSKTPEPAARAPLASIKTFAPLELVCIDFWAAEDRHNKSVDVLVITDHFIKLAHAFPCRNQSAKSIAKKLWDGFFCIYGFPQYIHSNQGANFESELIAELLHLAGVDKSRTSPYHPMGNGGTERFNRTLGSMLTSLPPESKQKWP